jgi:hypothetical protein
MQKSGGKRPKFKPVQKTGTKNDAKSPFAHTVCNKVFVIDLVWGVFVTAGRAGVK